MFSKRATVLLSAAAMAVLMLAAAGMAWAQETSSTYTLNPTPDDTWMTNGVVKSIVRHGDYIYVGGKFTKVRPSPTSPGFLATNLARFDADTGEGDPTWTPDVTGADMTKVYVYSLAATADGKIWVGGKFGAVDGVARRNLAAVDPITAGVDAGVDPLVGSETSTVRDMVASGEKVYIGGTFGNVDGKGRRNLAALDLSGNVDLKWKPKADKAVRSLAFSKDGLTVFAGGTFLNAAGSDGVYDPRTQVARFDVNTGALDPWKIPAGIVGGGENAEDLAVTEDRITVAFLGPNFLRSFRLDNGSDGALAWADKCGGDPQTVEMLGADKVVVGGHFSHIAGEKRTRIALVNLSDGSPDPNWTPKIGGHWEGPWALLVDENRLYVGGRFTTVDDSIQHHFARFTFF